VLCIINSSSGDWHHTVEIVETVFGIANNSVHAATEENLQLMHWQMQSSNKSAGMNCIRADWSNHHNGPMS